MGARYGAAHFRLRQQDFEELAHFEGTSPAWPLRYADFEPWYQKAEEMYHVHGQRGEDPTEPPCSGPYPHPPVAHESRMQKLVDDLRSAGLHPFHAPSGVMLDEANLAFSRCRKCNCNCCDGFPCLVHAKSDAEVLGMRPALAAPNVSLLTRSQVKRLVTDESGRTVKAVELERDGEPLKVSGNVVVVSCGAANSARLLLMSANDSHPRGLAKGSDQVGRHYMFHNSKAMVARAHEPNPTVFQKTVSIKDWYLGDADFDYPMGNIQMTGKTNRRTRDRLLGFQRGSSRSRLPGNPDRHRSDPAELHPQQPHWLDASVAPFGGNARSPVSAQPPGGTPDLHRQQHGHRRRGPPSRHLSLRQRSGQLGAGSKLQSPRTRQSLCRRYQHHAYHRGRESLTHGHRQCPAGRHPSGRATERLSQPLWGLPRHTSHGHR